MYLNWKHRLPYRRYISAEISAEILLIWCRKLSPPKIISAEYLSPPNIYLRRIFISAEYLSPPNIYLRRIYISAEYLSPPKFFAKLMLNYNANYNANFCKAKFYTCTLHVIQITNQSSDSESDALHLYHFLLISEMKIVPAKISFIHLPRLPKI